MQVTVADLTIHQLKTLGKAVEVNNWSKLVKADLAEAIKLKVADPATLQKHIDAMLSTEEKRQAAGKSNGKKGKKSDTPVDRTKGLSKEKLEEVRLDAMMDIAKASGARMKAEGKLRSLRKELNQDVSEAKASHKGAMERDVDYDDPESVRDKLEAVTMAWQGWQDELERRRQELDPLKEKLKKCRTRERKAFEDARQLKMKF